MLVLHRAHMPFRSDLKSSSYRNVAKTEPMRQFSAWRTMAVGASTAKASRFRKPTRNTVARAVRVAEIRNDHRQVTMRRHVKNAHHTIA